jgi:hypothetical protein
VYEDLFAQAEMLATLDVTKPKQANLRRALSAAYYAVFHYLVHEACCVQMGSQHTQASYRHVLARAFTHVIMKQACVSFGGGTLRAAVAKGLPTAPGAAYRIPQPIRDLAAMFVDLQDRRHLADYDLTERFIRSDVLMLIENAKRRVAAFAQLPASDDKRFFLACLWAWKELANR